MPVDRKDFKKALGKKGFTLEQGSRDHDVYLFHDQGLKDSIVTKVSRGSSYRTIDDSLVPRLRRQLRLTRSQFFDFVNCPLSAEGYRECLVEQGLIQK